MPEVRLLPVLAVALGVGWALHDWSHGVGLDLGFGPVGWLTRAGVVAAVLGGVASRRGTPGTGAAVAVGGAGLVLLGSVVGWAAAAPAPPGVLASAYVARRAGWPLALAVRVVLPVAVLAAALAHLRRPPTP